MAEGLGVWLRRAREARQLTLEDAEEKLRIRRRYLQALEMADYAALPGEIQTRGFLRNYARFLGIPVEEALARYEAEVGGYPLQPQPRLPKEEARRARGDRPSPFTPPPSEEEERAGSPARIPGWVFVLLLGAAALFGTIALASFLFLRFSGGGGATPDETPALTAVPTTPNLAVPTEPAEEAPEFVPAVDGTVSVTLDAQAHAWVRVVADGETVYQGVAATDQTIGATASDRILVETGNGGAFRLSVNGDDWGALGGQGAVVRRAWSPTGEVELQGP
jgi:transcriptional regulator with XRE-family HTH domain